MKCIIALMVSALIVAYEVGYGNVEHPLLGMAVCLVMMWGVFKLIHESI